jgi:hypothetical protein
LHVHHRQEETIRVLNGRFKLQIGDETFRLGEDGSAYLPSRLPNAFLNLTADPGEVVVAYAPGGGQRYNEQLGPLTRNRSPTARRSRPCSKHGVTLLGPPLGLD